MDTLSPDGKDGDYKLACTKEKLSPEGKEGDY